MAQARYANGPFPNARKCMFKDGYNEFKSKIRENCIDRNTSNRILGTSFLRESEHIRDFANKLS